MQGRYRRLGAVSHIEPREETVRMPLHGPNRDMEFRRNLLIGQPFHDQSQYLGLASAQIRAGRTVGERLAYFARQVLPA